MPPSVYQTLRKAERYAKRGEIDRAAQEYKRILQEFPGNRRASDGLNALEQHAQVTQSRDARPSKTEVDELIALFDQRKDEETLALGETLSERYPNIAFIPNLLGAVNARLGNLPQAQANYARALQIKPDFAEALSNLGNVLKDLGRPEDAAASYRKALEIEPDFAEVHNNLGTALRVLGALDDAVASYEEAVRIKPDFTEAHNNLGNALKALGRPEEAVRSFRRALRIDPENARANSNLGNALLALGKPREAVEFYRTALQLSASFPEAHNNLGVVLDILGASEEAVASYQEALRIKPDYAQAHRNLSVLKKYSDGDPQIAQMLELMQRHGISHEDRMHLSFALGKAFDDTGDYDEAFRYFADANRLRKQDLSYDISTSRSLFAQMKSTFSGDVTALNALQATVSDEGKIPVFILGMPRSGTSLVEQILASHSQVYGSGELQLFDQAVAAGEWSSGHPSADQLKRIRQRYLTGLMKIGVPERYMTDKMPLNFFWLGFIATAIPEAKIVHVKRDARATCWSIFRHHFPREDTGYCNDLRDVAEYYKLYAELMKFWHATFPGRIYDLSYESLTEHQEVESRKLLEYVGLDWEDRCLDFHETDRAVQTLSSAQVRTRMYRGSSEQWRRYEGHLGTMVELLRDL